MFNKKADIKFVEIVKINESWRATCFGKKAIRVEYRFGADRLI